MILNKLNLNGAAVMVVDDEERNRKLISKWLKDDGYDVTCVSSGATALTLATALEPDLILLDIMMPGMDGFEVATRLKEDPASKNIPIIMVTALNDKPSLIRGLACGAEEFLTKPLDNNELQIRVRNMLRLKKAADQLKNQNERLEKTVEERTRQLQHSYLAAVEALGKAADYRDDETGAHVRRISYYSNELAQFMGQDKSFCNTIFYASPLHDIGKIGTPDNVLFKQGGLDSGEWEIMKRHAPDGAKILSGLDCPITNMGREIALCHHERWDGSGYPNGIRGEAIPLGARIMSICDVYDALRSKRPYKEAFSHEKSAAIILEGDGRTSPAHFDPQVLRAFGQCAEKFDQIFNQQSEASEK